MDWNVGTAVVTLMAAGDGSVSLYFENGGGIIGAGAHEQVRVPALAFRQAMLDRAADLEPAREYPLPGPQQVIFWLLTAQETRGSGPIAVSDLMRADHVLGRVGALAQATISALRELYPGAK